MYLTIKALISLIVLLCSAISFLYFEGIVVFDKLQENEVSFSKIQNEVNNILSEYFNEDLEEKNISISMNQIDKDENMEILVLIREQYDFQKPNFFIIDKVNGKYIEVFNKQRIKNFNIYNNSLLVLETDLIGVGTDISESFYYIYMKINNEYIELFKNDKDAVYADPETTCISYRYGDIDIINNKFYYSVIYYVNEVEEIYKKKEINEIYEFYDNKFKLLEKKN